MKWDVSQFVDLNKTKCLTQWHWSEMFHRLWIWIKHLIQWCWSEMFHSLQIRIKWTESVISIARVLGSWANSDSPKVPAAAVGNGCGMERKIGTTNKSDGVDLTFIIISRQVTQLDAYYILSAMHKILYPSKSSHWEDMENKWNEWLKAELVHSTKRGWSIPNLKDKVKCWPSDHRREGGFSEDLGNGSYISHT